MAGCNGSHRRASGADSYTCKIGPPKSTLYVCISGLKVSSFQVPRGELEEFFQFLPQLKTMWFVSIDYVSRADYSAIKSIKVP